jgi:GGDEF domain-containing protein
MDEHDVPQLALTFTSGERNQILIALWHDYLTQLTNRNRMRQARREATGEEDNDETVDLLAFDAMQVDESLFDLVRKFGGDVDAQAFIHGAPPRS